jgi:hypothetical protein
MVTMKYSLSLFLSLFVFFSPLSAQGRTIYQVEDPTSSLDDGWSRNVANAGDLNGDGVNDLIVAADRDSTTSQAGRVDLLSGADGSLLYNFTGTSSFERYGAIISGAGDINNDGYDDFLIGCDDGTTIDFYSGMDGSLLFQVLGLAYTTAADSAAPCGDWDGDGYDDVVLAGAGSSTNASSMGLINNGWARVHSGLDGSIISMEFEGDLNEGRLGFEIAVGDIDADGVQDIVLASQFANSSAGVVKAFSGFTGSIMFTLNGTSSNDRLGSCIDLLDINADGHLDIAVGATGTDYGISTGSVYIYDGATYALLNRLDGPGPNSTMDIGYSVMNAGDINSDGRDDYMVGSAYASNGPPIYHQGVVQVYSGNDHSLLMEYWGRNYRSEFGHSMANLGDVDADGIEDYVIGAPAQLQSLTAEIYVISSTVNQAPVAGDDFYNIEQDTPTAFDVMANDVDPENDTLYITIDSQPDYGTAALLGDQIEYSPNPFFVGIDTFTYSIYDPSGDSTQATVTIDVDQIIRLAVDPLIPGYRATFDVARCEPNSWFYLCYSLAGNGPTNIGNYQGMHFSLELSAPIKSRPPILLNNLGETSFRILVPSTIPSGTVIWMQGVALDLAGGTGLTISNAVEQAVW